MTTTRANQVTIGTTANTYTMAGITSAASRAVQTGTMQFVTSDANGNLAMTNNVATASSVSSLQNSVAGLQNSVAKLQSHTTTNAQRAKGGIAAALAASGLRFGDRHGKIFAAGGVAGWEGQFGVAGGLGGTRPRMAVGCSARPSPRRPWLAAGPRSAARAAFRTSWTDAVHFASTGVAHRPCDWALVRRSIKFL